jgi:hypothetical protein
MFQSHSNMVVCQFAGEIKSPEVRAVRGLHFHEEIFCVFLPAGPKAAPAAFGPAPDVITET